MIKELERIVFSVGKDSEIQISRFPNNQEIMDKLNEVIACLNRLEKETVKKPIKGRGTI